MSKLIHILFVMLNVLLIVCALATTAMGKDRMNIVLLMADQVCGVGIAHARLAWMPSVHMASLDLLRQILIVWQKMEYAFGMHTHRHHHVHRRELRY